MIGLKIAATAFVLTGVMVFLGMYLDLAGMPRLSMVLAKACVASSAVVLIGLIISVWI